MSGPALGDWLVEWPARMAPLADLLCFAGAGAGAAPFRGWAARLPAYVSVLACRMPGREARIGEPFVSSLAGAADCIAQAYLGLREPPRRLVLFGHSMGAVLAFEVTRRLSRQGRRPDLLALAASTPPGGKCGATIDAEALRALMLSYDGANARITENPELFDAVGPAIAADIAMLRAHSVAAETVETPALLLNGTADEIVPAAETALWSAKFAGPVEQRSLPGGHFFPFRESEAEVLKLLARHLAAQAV